MCIRRLSGHASTRAEPSNPDAILNKATSSTQLSSLWYVEQILEIAKMSRTSPSSYNSGYLSGTPSPLAPINPNACLRFSLQKVQMASRGQTSSDTSKYSHKRATQNPLLQCKPSKEEDRKRQVFLKKVRQASDDKKWETRSEQVRGHHN